MLKHLSLLTLAFNFEKSSYTIYYSWIVGKKQYCNFISPVTFLGNTLTVFFSYCDVFFDRRVLWQRYDCLPSLSFKERFVLSFQQLVADHSVGCKVIYLIDFGKIPLHNI